MNILHIAYSLDESSAATRLAKAQHGADTVFFLLGRPSASDFINLHQVAKIWGMLVGILFHVLNIILFKFLRIEKGEIFSFNFGVFFQKLILKGIVKKYSINVIHIHWGGYGFFPLDAAAGQKIPIFITAHDFQVFTGGCHVPMDCTEFGRECQNCPLAQGKFGKLALRMMRASNAKVLKKLAPEIIAPSNYVKREILTKYPFLNVTVIPNTLDKKYFSEEFIERERGRYFRFPIKNAPTIITVGVSSSKRQNKGIDILQQVLDRLSCDGIEFNYVSIGDYVNCTGAKSRVHFQQLCAVDLMNHYLGSDICLLPSRFETFSMVSLEAVCSGVHVVAFNNSGPGEIVTDNFNGKLVPAFDIDAFYSATKQLIRATPWKAATASDQLARYLPQEVAARHREIYKSLRFPVNASY